MDSLNARNNLTEQLADLNNDVADYFLEHDSIDNIPSELLINAVKKITMEQAS